MTFDLVEIVTAEEDGVAVEQIARVKSDGGTIRKGFDPSLSRSDLESQLASYLLTIDPQATLEAGSVEVRTESIVSPPTPPRQFTKLQVTEALFDLIGEANTDAALQNMKANDRRAYLRWEAASKIDEDDEDFIAQLNAMGVALTDLKATIDS